MPDSNTPLLNRRKVVKIAQETTIGTAIAAGSATVLPFALTDIKCVPDDFTADGDRMLQGNYLGSYPNIIGVKTGTVSFKMEWHAQLNETALMTTLLNSCGFSDYSSGVGYSLRHTLGDMETCTLYVYEDGRLKGIRGAMGSFNLSAENGKRFYLEFEFKGSWINPVDAALPTVDPTNSATAPVVAKTCTLDWGGGTAVGSFPQVANFSLDLAAEVNPRQAMSDDNGVQNFYVEEFDPSITLDPEARLVAGFDAYGIYSGATLTDVNLICTIPGTTSTKTLAFGDCQVVGIGDDERDKKLVDSLTLKPVEPGEIFLDL